MSKVSVVGASGQLGQCIKAESARLGNKNFVFLTKENASIIDLIALKSVFKDFRPKYCINCAAYTAVDKAEDEAELALRINRDGVSNLAQLCNQFNTTLIHISTDFVFSGSGSTQPFSESDKAIPLNVYGMSKLEGELAIPALLDQYFILRTSWLYSKYGNNFVKTMLRFGKEKEEIRVIWDQLGTPTNANDLANCIIKIIESGSDNYGIYHYSNEGVISWYDFAKAIFDLSDIPVKVIPVRTAEYFTKAKRPAFSVMDKTKIKNNFNIEIPYWRESLETCVRLIKA